jgi:hypothetical protein
MVTDDVTSDHYSTVKKDLQVRHIANTPSTPVHGRTICRLTALLIPVYIPMLTTKVILRLGIPHTEMAGTDASLDVRVNQYR